MATKKEKVEETPVEETEETPEGLTCSEVAEKMNTVLGLQGEDVIDTTLEDDDMKPDILKAAGLVGMDPKTDKFSQKLADKDKADLGDDVWAWLEENEMLTHIPKPEPEKPKAGKPAKEKLAKAASGKKVGSATPGKGPGVIAAILDILKATSETKPVTKEDMLKQLGEKFPDRELDSMKATINVQIPSRMSKEKGVTIVKGDKGYYIEK